MLSFVLYILLSQVLFAQTFNPAEITKKTAPGVVFIKGITAEGNAVGTGFLISSDGKIVTALHIIRNFKSGGVQLANGEVFDSFVILAFDQRKDLAIIKVSGFDLPGIELGNSNQVSAGEQVVLIGSPQGLQGSVTTGVVSAIRDFEGFKIIQTELRRPLKRTSVYPVVRNPKRMTANDNSPLIAHIRSSFLFQLHHP